MRSTRSLPVTLAMLTLVMYVTGVSRARAADVLIDGGLEMSAGPAGWTLTQSITGEPGLPVSAVEHLDAGNEPEPITGELGLLLKSTVGNTGDYAGQLKQVNAILSQTVAVGANRHFTFTGHSFFQASASAIVDTLNAITPLGDYNLDTSVNAADYTIWRNTLGSTTDFRANGTNEGDSLDIIDQADYDYWKERFGNVGRAAGAASPTQSVFKVEFLDAGDAVLATHTIDLRDDPTTEAWRTQSLAGLVSPAGTTQARVTAAVTDMVASCSSDCAAGQDIFLDNFSLLDTDLFGGQKLVNGDLNELGAPAGFVIEKTSEDNLSFAGAASFAAHDGGVGMWLRSFNGGNAKILQTVAATPGADYDFSAWSKWEEGYIDLDPIHPEVQTTMTLEYLDASSAVIGSPIELLLDTVQEGDGMWRQFTVDGGTAPANAAFVRVSAGAINMGDSGVNPQSAFFDDFALVETLPGAGSLATVPEPGTLLLLSIALGVIGAGRRRI